MKITGTPIIQRTNIYVQKNKNNENKHNQKTITTQIKYTNVFAYRDFEITFTGRTPENFYKQDFNRNNMPISMKEYLEYDYENRQHIPPEQMMNEVFKYLNIANNFSDVKSVYPNETLFQNLHENNSKNKSSVLYEIKTTKEMSDIPLLKNGDNNFGMYLLKKIYVQGKTIKEINKDFYDKDLNEVYKGIITKPITKEGLKFYGIRTPKHAFWHSFIATREEYRKFFVTLPKNSVNPAVYIRNKKNEEPITSSFKAPKKNQRHERKFKIKDFEKKQFTDDLKSTNLTNIDVEKKIRKRFAKDEPQASFIIKYFSPIMTVASDRAHLSEDLKYFIADEKLNGKNGKESEMLQRYWNRNPIMKTVYSHAITDTIDMFEDIYGNGGSIPINTSLEEVTPNTKNIKVIDTISPEYKELLDYTQTIYPKREEKYDLHKKEQEKWEKYFNEKYGNIESEKNVNELLPKTKENFLSDNLEKEFDEDNFSIDQINKEFLERIKNKFKILPNPLLKEYYNFVTDNADLTFKMKVSNLPKDCTIEDIQEIDRTDASPDYIDDLNTQFLNEYNTEMEATDCAIKHLTLTYSKGNKTLGKAELNNLISAHKKEFDTLYSNYTKPMTERETNLATLAVMNGIDNYKNNPQVDSRTNAIILMLQDIIKLNNNQRQKIRTYLKDMLPDYTKSILDKNLNKEDKYQLFTFVMKNLIKNYLFDNEYLPVLVNKETIDKYSPLLSSFDTDKINKMERLLPQPCQLFYNASNEEIKEKFHHTGFIDIPGSY